MQDGAGSLTIDQINKSKRNPYGNNYPTGRWVI